MDVKIESSWKQQLQAEFEQPYFSELIAFVKSEYATQRVYPPGKLIFNAFDKCPFDQTKV
ncbi:MAG: uracil-DNA glycosylase, partial [Runella slithyformis]